jgi:hypothetical protein
VLFYDWYKESNPRLVDVRKCSKCSKDSISTMLAWAHDMGFHMAGWSLEYVGRNIKTLGYNTCNVLTTLG